MTAPVPRSLDAASVRAALVVVGLAVVLAALWWWSGRSTEVAEVGRAEGSTPQSPVVSGLPEPTPPVPPGSGDTEVPPPSQGEELVVDVRGAVRKPGVRTLVPGARVHDAVEAAGGLRRGRSYGDLNLARPIVDGEQIRVGPQQHPIPEGPTSGSAAATGSASTIGVDLNTASVAQLETLGGVGEVLAGRIVAWRDENGGFSSVEDLLNVSGIGERTLEGIRDSVTVG